MQKFVVSFFSILLIAISAHAQVFKNISSLQSGLGFDNYYDTKLVRAVKVAVFDKGFTGYKSEIGRSLPAKTFYVPGPVTAPDDLQTEHGFRMAQILTALATNNMQKPAVIQELYLYNVFGYSNFKAAVDDAIARHIDVISYSEVWEYGGNNDGQGFINKQVSRATAAGITWVNAAGNFNLTTYNGAITTLADDWVQLPDQNNALELRCEKNNAGKCGVRIVLSWNDFKNDVDPGTNKDLDIAITDDLLNIQQNSSLQQSADPNEARPGFSKYPREIITAELKVGTYYLRIKNRSKNFTAKDRLRIAVDGENITMPSHSQNESVLNPADNPSVITVGASDSDRSSVSTKMDKPDIMAPSSMILNGSEFRGSSNATAVVAAGIALLKATSSNYKSVDQILNRISRNFDWDQRGLSMQYFGFAPTAQGCFQSREWSEAPDNIKMVVANGGVLVETTAQVRLMVPFDPIKLAPDLQRRQANDMVVSNSDLTYEVYPRNSQIPQGSVEVFQRPFEAGLCSLPAKRRGNSFRL
jgi:hypothetical protein